MRKLNDKEIQSIATKLHDDILAEVISKDQIEKLIMQVKKKYATFMKHSDAKVLAKYGLTLAKYFSFEHKTTKYIATTKFKSNKMQLHAEYLSEIAVNLYIYPTLKVKSMSNVRDIIRYHSLTAENMQALIKAVKDDLK